MDEKNIPHVDVIVSGAGISMDTPSFLPSGDELKHVIWDCLIAFFEKKACSFTPENQTRIFSILSNVRNTPGHGINDPNIRLEQLVGILTEDASLQKLRNIYLVMSNATPNANHWYMANMKSCKHFTLNMDTMLEDAGTTDVHHLHGRWDDIDSIRTSNRDYFSPLGQSIKEEFSQAIKGKNVLVVGYSGRDIDVMPIFQILDKEPASLLWVQHRSPSGKKSNLAYEVEDLLTVLDRRKVDLFDSPNRVLLDDTGVFLKKIYKKQQKNIGAVVQSPLSYSETQEAIILADAKKRSKMVIDSISSELANGCEIQTGLLAAAKVCFASGMHQAGLELLEYKLFWINGRPYNISAAQIEMSRRKLTARLLRRKTKTTTRGNTISFRAIRNLTMPPPIPLGIKAMFWNANELASLFYFSRSLFFLGAFIDKFVIYVPLMCLFRDKEKIEKTKTQAKLRRLQRVFLSSNMKATRQLILDTIPEPSEWKSIAINIDIESVASGLSVLTDYYRTIGDYKMADMILRYFGEATQYASLLYQAYFNFRRVEFFLYSGRWLDSSKGEAVINEIDQALNEAEILSIRSGDNSQGWWILGIQIAWQYLSGKNIANHDYTLSLLDKAKKANDASERWARSYVFIAIASARAWDGSDAMSAIKEARKTTNGITRLRYYWHIIDIIEAYVISNEGTKGLRRARRLLKRAVTFYKSNGIHQLVARCMCMELKLSGEVSHTLAETCANNGWFLESKCAETGTDFRRLIWFS